MKTKLVLKISLLYLYGRFLLVSSENPNNNGESIIPESFEEVGSVSRSMLKSSRKVRMLQAQGPTANSSKLATGFSAQYTNSGYMFDIMVLKKLKITKLGLHMSATSTPVSVEAYSKTGTYKGYQRRPGAWSQIGNGSVIGAGFGEETDFLLIKELVLLQNQVSSLYITLTENGDSLHFYGESLSSDSQLASYVSNNDIKMSSGVGKSYPFGFTDNAKVWNGALYYTLITDGGENEPTISPTKAPSPDYVTLPPVIFEVRTPENGPLTLTDGNMMDIVSTETIDPIFIKSIEINCKPDDAKVSAKIYSKDGSHVNYERRPSAWIQEAFIDNISCKGDGERTVLTSFDPIVIAAGESKALYITIASNKKLMYNIGISSDSTVDSELTSSDHLKMSVGKTVMYEFRNNYFEGNVWKGAIKYTVGIDTEIKAPPGSSMVSGSSPLGEFINEKMLFSAAAVSLITGLL